MNHGSMEKEQLCREIERLQARVLELEKNHFHRGAMPFFIEYPSSPVKYNKYASLNLSLIKPIKNQIQSVYVKASSLGGCEENQINYLNRLRI